MIKIKQHFHISEPADVNFFVKQGLYDCEIVREAWGYIADVDNGRPIILVRVYGSLETNSAHERSHRKQRGGVALNEERIGRETGRRTRLGVVIRRVLHEFSS